MALPNTAPHDLLTRFSENEPPLCFLASSASDGWKTILARRPAAVFSYKHTAGATHGAAQFLAFAKEQLARGRLLIGAIGYELGYELISLPREPYNDLNLPDIFFYSFDNYLSFDERAANLTGDDAASTLLFHPSPPFTRSWYKAAYTRAMEHICAGDIYQINLTHRLEAQTKENPRALFQHLLRQNPAPFQGYIEGDDFAILASSPERFIRVRGDIIETYPIKGTRPRGESSVDDERLKRELLESGKERAELTMITDLLRNDIGKVSEIGTVEVVNPRAVSGHRSVWHTYAHIRGRLQKNITAAEALISMFPGGSVTGCPKKRAMELITALEPYARGFYTGAIGYIEPSGECDMAITIRTLVIKNNTAYLNVGAGVVYDSNVNREWNETFDKARPFIV